GDHPEQQADLVRAETVTGEARPVGGGLALLRPPLSQVVEVSPLGCPIYGRMFWFSRKKFVGSYLPLSFPSPPHFASPSPAPTLPLPHLALPARETQRTTCIWNTTGPPPPPPGPPPCTRPREQDRPRRRLCPPQGPPAGPRRPIPPDAVYRRRRPGGK